METLTTAAALAGWRARSQATLGLVPTMGNLHAGHMALIHAACAQCERVVASIFVNPLQFGPGEDLDSYPRTFEADCAALERAGVDAVFAPEVEQLVARERTTTTVRVAGITDMLCGARRPGHFEGVATIVAKLLNLVRPDRAYFGEKDFQQLLVIRRMVADLCMGVAIVGVPTVRDDDGLARSSRNQYLSADQRERAAILAATLADCREALAAGERDFARLQARGWQRLTDAGLQPDYFEIRDETLADPSHATHALRVFAAVWLGSARLIDNMPVADAEARALL